MLPGRVEGDRHGTGCVFLVAAACNRFRIVLTSPEPALDQDLLRLVTRLPPRFHEMLMNISPLPIAARRLSKNAEL